MRPATECLAVLGWRRGVRSGERLTALYLQVRPAPFPSAVLLPWVNPGSNPGLNPWAQAVRREQEAALSKG
jgi:hypothetical protein